MSIIVTQKSREEVIQPRVPTGVIRCGLSGETCLSFVETTPLFGGIVMRKIRRLWPFDVMKAKRGDEGQNIEV